MMRIISGKHRGRIIESLSSKKLRPTTGRTREAVFNILSHGRYSDLLDGARVLDLFCGCGALAMEALSRGADHVTLVDIDAKHLDVARKNIRTLGEESNATFVRGDSSSPPPASAPCTLVFLDPPYHQHMVERALKAIVLGGWLTKNAIVVIETGKTEDVDLPEQFTLHTDRTYGNSRIRIAEYLG